MSSKTSEFVLSSLAVIVVPGPDLILITRIALRNGRGRAVEAAAGMITAGGIQAFVGFAGLAVLLRAHPDMLTTLQWLGAGALGIWGSLILRSAIRPARGTVSPQPDTARLSTRRGRCYLQGLMCTGCNPKVGLFLLAFLPQFLPPDASSGAMAVLAIAYLAMGFGWLLTWTNIVHRIRRNVLTDAVLRRTEILISVLFIALAIRLALH